VFCCKVSLTCCAPYCLLCHKSSIISCLWITPSVCTHGTKATVYCVSTTSEDHDLTERQWHFAETRCFQEILHSGHGSEMRVSRQCPLNYTPTDARRQYCLHTTPAYCPVSPRSFVFTARYELSLKLRSIRFMLVLRVQTGLWRPYTIFCDNSASNYRTLFMFRTRLLLPSSGYVKLCLQHYCGDSANLWHISSYSPPVPNDETFELFKKIDTSILSVAVSKLSR